MPGAAEIAAALESHGQCVFTSDPLLHQHLVDVHWAAHRAGQLLGIKVRVAILGPAPGDASKVTVVVTPRNSARSSSEMHPA